MIIHSKVCIMGYLQYGLWAHYTGSELFLYQCPPGYCQCHRGNSDFSQYDCLSIYTADNENLQCDCNREGENSDSVCTGISSMYKYFSSIT